MTCKASETIGTAIDSIMEEILSALKDKARGVEDAGNRLEKWNGLRTRLREIYFETCAVEADHEMVLRTPAPTLSTEHTKTP